MKSIKGLNANGGLLRLDPWMMSELEQSEATFRKPVFSLDFRPFSPLTESVEEREDIVFVFGYFCLMYCHETIQKNTRKLFRICAGDASIRQFMKLGDFGYRVYGWDDFLEQCKTNKCFDFLRRVTTISKELFDLARENYAVRLPFTIDSVKYVREVGQPTSLSALTNMKRFIDMRAGKRKKGVTQ